MKIFEYDLKTLPVNPCILLIGRRRSGKSVNTMSLMYHYRNTFKWGLAFVGSNASIRDYVKIMPSSFVYDQLDFNVLQTLIDRQNAAANRGDPEQVFVLIDDLAYSSQVFKHKLIKQLYANGRHLGVTLIITTQYALAVPPLCRGNTDVVLASQEKSAIYRRKLFETFSIVFNTFGSFDKTYRACTKNYETFVMVSCSDNQKDDVSSNCFWWKSLFPLPEFKVNPNGRWWKIHLKRHDPNGNTSCSSSGEIVKVSLAQQQAVHRAVPVPVQDEVVEEKKENIWIKPRKLSRFS